MVDMTATIPRSNAWRGSTLLRFVLNRRTCRSKEPALTQKSTQEGNGGGGGAKDRRGLLVDGKFGRKAASCRTMALVGLTR